jgi:hypothetical protein
MAKGISDRLQERGEHQPPVSAQPEENLSPRSAVNRVTLLKNEEFDKACDQ